MSESHASFLGGASIVGVGSGGDFGACSASGNASIGGAGFAANGRLGAAGSKGASGAGMGACSGVGAINAAIDTTRDLSASGTLIDKSSTVIRL